MVCCQPSGKNDPEQIAASFPRQGGAEGEGGGRRASERTDFPHSAYDIRRPRPRPSAFTRPPAAADDRARSVSSSSSPRRPRPKHCRMFYGIVDCPAYVWLGESWSLQIVREDYIGCNFHQVDP